MLRYKIDANKPKAVKTGNKLGFVHKYLFII